MKQKTASKFKPFLH